MCTGDGLSDQHTLMIYISAADVDIVDLYEKGRERVRKEKEAAEKKQSEGKVKEKKKKKKDVGPPEGLATQTSVASDMGITKLFAGELCARTVGMCDGIEWIFTTYCIYHNRENVIGKEIFECKSCSRLT